MDNDELLIIISLTKTHVAWLLEVTKLNGKYWGNSFRLFPRLAADGTLMLLLLLLLLLWPSRTKYIFGQTKQPINVRIDVC